jgi:trimeric autotransporter adhesin
MSTTSRRGATNSRRRLALAAGAILAGAAIPFAAAGTAWADDTTTQTTPDKTETLTQLEHQGLDATNAGLVTAAESSGEAVEVSYNGKIVVDDNNTGGTASTDAAAKSAAKDVAAAIGGGTTSTASGTGAVAVADGADTTGNADSAKASGFGAIAISWDDLNTKVSATGTDAYAHDYLSNGDTFTAKGTASEVYGEENTNVTLTANGTTTEAYGVNSNGSTATATNTGPYSWSNPQGYYGFAEVENADNSKANASGMGSVAWVNGYSTYESTGENISGSNAVDNNGTTTIVTASGINSTNGNVVHPEVTSLPVHVEVTPLTDVHVMPAMPLP